ncbi:Wnt-3a [Labeo rohita]|uniref:Protein Wnt n=1 Tax=Labeo rohita TaxID=84645 RepID=A0A498M9Q8_LABRO|nr:Wnt-3a [Labeo rohita]
MVEFKLTSLAVGHQYTSLGTQPILCSSIPGLVPKQLRFCRNYLEIMPSVAEGVKIGIQECQHQFRGRRWNCTTINDNLAIFGPVLDKATRESAFVHAIASAGVAFAVTRACSEGSVTICGCDTRRKGPPGEGWKWGGCSEDVEFGSMSITDHMYLKCKCHGLSGSCEVKTCWWSQPDFRVIGDYMKDKYDSASEMVVEKHRESRGWVETLRPKYTFFKPPTETDLVYYESSPNFCEPNPETGSFGTRDRICNLTSHGIDGCDLLCCGRGHNTRTEKRKEKCHCIFHWCCYSITDHMYLKCKCHGLSGSCEVKTCWWSQPDFRVIGDYMKDKYDSASEMVVEKHRESRGWVETLRPKYTFFKPPTETDLVYYESSPNFCEPNPETGSFGTRDRICNLTSHGIDGCDLLCCGRGHNTRTEKRKEKCHCIFHWCCYVSCQECTRVYDVHTCK